MQLIGFAGWSGAGKTTLIAKLIPLLAMRGLTVSTVKHAHHAFDIDQPGKDSWVHRQAGAAEVIVSSPHRFALMRELRGAPEPTLSNLVAKLSIVDIVIVEGFKSDAHPKIEVFRPEMGKPPLHIEDPTIIAVASPTRLSDTEIRWLPLDAPLATADFIVSSSPTWVG